MYIRCFGIQFSFHYIDIKRISPNIINSISNETVRWDGIRLQPMALELFHLAKEVMINNISDKYEVKQRFQALISEM